MHCETADDAHSEKDILTDLSGVAIGCEHLSTFLKNSLSGIQVQQLEVVPGTERRWPQSTSAKVKLTMADGSTRVIFLKKAVAASMQVTTCSKLRSILLSNRCEARFYQEFAPQLQEHGVAMPHALFVDQRLGVLDNLPEEVSDDAKIELLRSCGMLLLLDSAEGYYQQSPLNASQAACCLRSLARLHAAAWENEALLTSAAERLHAVGGTWRLGIRGDATDELFRQMHETWPRYVEAFTPVAPSVFCSQGVCSLAERVESLALWVNAELRATPQSQFATLIHGDFKAANAFLPEGHHASDGIAMQIDFQWVGPGFGMSDVAMTLIHSVAHEALCDGGDERLVELYLEALMQELPTGATSYTRDAAWRLYRLAVVDYARQLLPNFPTESSLEYFEAKAAAPRAENIGMVWRDRRASIRLVARVNEYLQSLEDESE